jgi:hypothetical protein
MLITLQFSTNWNGKLFLDNFGTVRLHNPSKYFIGNKLEVQLKGTRIGEVEIVAIRSFYFKNISDTLAYIDCGKPAAYLAGMMKRMYENKVQLTPETKLDHVTLHYYERSLETHAELLKLWWQDKYDQQQSKPVYQPTIFE